MIAGPSGIGKTSLARYVAYRLRERFHDGQLFCGIDRRAPPSRAVRLLLDALGVPRSELFEVVDLEPRHRRLLCRPGAHALR